MTLFKQLLINSGGRDFVVGDLHGNLTRLEKVLEYHQFKPDRDRVISVGDLIDRGTDSMNTLRLLSEPWFFSVAGNHERLLSQYRQALTQRQLDSSARKHLEAAGAQWLLDAYDSLNEDKWADLITEIMNLIGQMPLMIQIGNGANAVGVVHAELPDWDWNRNVARLERIKKVKFWDQPRDDPSIEPILWGRTQFQSLMRGEHRDRTISGIAWVIYGHSILSSPRRAGNRIWIDTGAYENQPDRGLSIVEIAPTLTVTTHFRDLRIRTERFNLNLQPRFHSVLMS
ncbi:MAG: metallophosphoesterase [Halothiobacillus sp.]